MQRTNLTRIIIFGLIGTLILSSVWGTFRQCSPPAVKNTSPEKTQKPTVALPAFQPDSAYLFVKKQVDFGPRVPNTEAHRKCAAWLSAEFRRLGLTVMEQKFTVPHYTGKIFNSVNIIGQYKPELPRRILYAAHWDSRFIADQDEKNPKGPVTGADDGGSGVGILLEMARLLQQQPANIGVDFVLFDVEDQGNDDENAENTADTWCLGSQYWSQHLHRPNYMPQFGILLDMVGGADPKFAKDGMSMQGAPSIVNLVWSTAADLGFGHVFVQEQGQGITDDHVYVMRNARIPMIDIINRPGKTKSGFVAHWHTQHDDMTAIDKNTLRMVGETCTAVLYRMAVNQ